jgi:hypothetical protein
MPFSVFSLTNPTSSDYMFIKQQSDSELDISMGLPVETEKMSLVWFLWKQFLGILVLGIYLINLVNVTAVKMYCLVLMKSSFLVGKLDLDCGKSTTLQMPPWKRELGAGQGMSAFNPSTWEVKAGG